MGHVLDASNWCFGAIRVGMKWSSPVKAHFQGRKVYTNINKKYSSIEKHFVVYIDHLLHYFYEPHYGLL